MLKKLMLLFVLGISVSAFAEETVVWCPKDKIGKNQMWKTNAEANVENDVLVMKFTGAQWSGVGLNWQSYWPADSGVKIADYTNLVVELKAEGDAKESLTIALKDNKHKPSDTVNVKKYCMGEQIPAAITKITIPLKDFLTDKSKMESGVVWEIMFGTWTEGEKNITVSVNKIWFTK